MNKILKSVALLLVLSLVLVGCGSGGTGETQGETDVVKIGIIQIAEHPALDSARQGFLDALAENGYKDGENLVVDYQNAQADQSNLSTIARKFVNDKVDLVLAIATPAAITMASETSEIPILITAVTDPVSAKLVESNERPGTNVTGTTDMTPVREQMELLTKLCPDVKTVGIIYNSSEINSEIQAGIAKEAAKELGLEIVESTVTNSSEVQQIAHALGERVEAIYVPTDNIIASSIASVVAVAEANKLPIIAGERAHVEAGALATIGIDYYKLGRQTGEMAIRVLNGADPATMPIEKQETMDIVINKSAAEKIGLTIPEEILKDAEIVE